MKEQGYQYTTDLLVIGCGFSGMWAAMRAFEFGKVWNLYLIHR